MLLGCEKQVGLNVLLKDTDKQIMTWLRFGSTAWTVIGTSAISAQLYNNVHFLATILFYTVLEE
jgi:hypothetical protein